MDNIFTERLWCSLRYEEVSNVQENLANPEFLMRLNEVVLIT